MMLHLQNGKERTTTELKSLLGEAGWKLERVVQGVDIVTQKAIATPA